MRISDWSSYVCSSDLVGSVVEANQWNLVETAAQGGFLAAQELVEPQHPIVWLGFEKILGQTRNQRCWRHLGDAQFQHQRCEERSVGKECLSTCSSACSPYIQKKKYTANNLHIK